MKFGTKHTAKPAETTISQFVRPNKLHGLKVNNKEQTEVFAVAPSELEITMKDILAEVHKHHATEIVDMVSEFETPSLAEP